MKMIEWKNERTMIPIESDASRSSSVITKAAIYSKTADSNRPLKQVFSMRVPLFGQRGRGRGRGSSPELNVFQKTGERRVSACRRAVGWILDEILAQLPARCGQRVDTILSARSTLPSSPVYFQWLHAASDCIFSRFVHFSMVIPSTDTLRSVNDRDGPVPMFQLYEVLRGRFHRTKNGDLIFLFRVTFIR